MAAGEFLETFPFTRSDMNCDVTLVAIFQMYGRVRRSVHFGEKRREFLVGGYVREHRLDVFARAEGVRLKIAALAKIPPRITPEESDFVRAARERIQGAVVAENRMLIARALNRKRLFRIPHEFPPQRALPRVDREMFPPLVVRSFGLRHARIVDWLSDPATLLNSF